MRSLFGNIPRFVDADDPTAMPLYGVHDNGRQTLFIAHQPGSLPPLPFGGALLRQVRVIVVARDHAAPPHESSAGLESAAGAGPPESGTPVGQVCPREVRGDILRDERGRLYERLGHRIQPLHYLVSGPRGVILDLAPAGQGHPQAEAPPTEQALAASAESEVETADRGAALRALLPDPGKYCVVCFGDFKDVLASQLSSPHRLRDSHRLACYVQVFEAVIHQRLRSAAPGVLESPDSGGPLRRLTPDAARKLGLVALAPLRHDARREPEMVLPGERLFALVPAADPTAHLPHEDPAGAEEARGEVAKVASAVRQAGDAAPLRRTVPERFLRPWEFQRSREEALYDFQVAAAAAGSLESRFSQFAGRLRGGRTFRRWLPLLFGKTPDEQLWTVRPPDGAFSRPEFREWARRTLELAGYQASTMLVEWELFWRRKGGR